MTRWWNQYTTIPWPDTFAVFVSANVHGQVNAIIKLIFNICMNRIGNEMNNAGYLCVFKAPPSGNTIKCNTITTIPVDESFIYNTMLAQVRDYTLISGLNSYSTRFGHKIMACNFGCTI